MRILATGRSGTIGKHLPDSVGVLELDLSRSLSGQPGLVDVGHSDIIHLAGVVGESRVIADIQHSRRVNITAVAELANEFLTHGSGTFYYVSSAHVYETSNGVIPETGATAPTSCYSEQKLLAELALRDLFHSEPLRLCIVRVFSVLDWGCPPESLGGAIRALALDNKRGPLINSEDVRDFLTPRTIADTLLRITQTGAAGVLNLCSSKPLSIKEAARSMFLSRDLDTTRLVFDGRNSPRPILLGDNTRLLGLIQELSLSWSPSRHGFL